MQRALVIRERVLGPNHLHTASSLRNLAALLHAQGELAAARPLYERALAIEERALGHGHRLTIGHRRWLEALVSELDQSSGRADSPR